MLELLEAHPYLLALASAAVGFGAPSALWALCWLFGERPSQRLANTIRRERERHTGDVSVLVAQHQEQVRELRRERDEHAQQAQRTADDAETDLARLREQLADARNARDDAMRTLREHRCPTVKICNQPGPFREQF